MAARQIVISHRGNLTGPNTATHGENHPQSMLDALLHGFGCEVDVRWVEGKGYYLGHDGPQYLIDMDIFATMCRDQVFVHCKDIITIEKLIDYKEMKSFFHQKESILH